jgi:DNA repair protein RadC
MEVLTDQPSFELGSVKRQCAVQPALITRLVNELVSQGWLVREGRESIGVYHWNSDRGQFSIRNWLEEKFYGSQLKSCPERERPRERLLEQGAENLRNSELLAILIRSGRPGQSAVDAAQRISNVFEGRLQELPSATRHELKAISSAVEKTAYCQIMAGIELGRRIAALTDRSITPAKITSTAEALEFCQTYFRRLALDSKQEEFHIVTLNTKNNVIDTHQISVGTLDASLVHPREVFRPAIKDSASSIILVHNHPSGDPTPSAEDLTVTRRLQESGKMIGIQVLDHIVLGRESATSVRESQ